MITIFVKKDLPHVKTIKDLYKWACDNHVEDFNICIYDKYFPSNPFISIDIDTDKSEITLG
jgi:hypothetical protein